MIKIDKNIKKVSSGLLRILGFILVYACLTSVIFAGSDNMRVKYQGFLQVNGGPVNGTKGFIFRIKNGSAGATQWESDCTNIAVSSGIFRAVIGETNGNGNWDAINWGGIDAFLEIDTGGSGCSGMTTLSSPERILSVPYSIWASSANYLSATGGKLKVNSSTVSVNGTDMYFVPQGLIIMWSGTLAQIPYGWRLCDGTNGTPDLRNKFIYGVDTGEDPGTNSAGSNHTHTVSHTHTFTIAGFTLPSPGSTSIGGGDEQSLHQHAASPPATTVGAATKAGGGAPAVTSADNFPPYYKLAYIMKM